MQITVDGQSYEVEEGRTILQALDDLGILMNGVDVPHYCWHPNLSIDGSCRLCQVEIEGVPKLQIACNTPVQDEMVIHTQNERVKQAREGVMELLLVNHPLDCPICDQAGECKLQDYAFAYGQQHARTEEPRRAGKKRVDLGPTILFDQERCILCRRCVRFCREVPGTGELAVFGRGDHSVIDTVPGSELDNDYSMNVADICPVGALTTKDFRFKIRVWFLEHVPGICTGCSNGCNVSIGVANNRAYRYVPRRNDAVNETWLCDAGRLSYARINADDRIQGAWVREDSGRLARASFDEAIATAASRLQSLVDRDGGRAVGLVVSPHMTNEELFTARRFADALGPDVAQGFVVAHGKEDNLLKKAEQAANPEGARRLGFGSANALLDALRAGSLRGLIVMGQDLLTSGALAELGALRSLETVIVLDTHHSAVEDAAQVIFGTRHTAEKLGTLTNIAGRVQRVEPAIEPAFDARSEGEVLWALGSALGFDGFGGGYDPIAVSKTLCQSEAAFAACALDVVDDVGTPIATQIAGARVR